MNQDNYREMVNNFKYCGGPQAHEYKGKKGKIRKNWENRNKIWQGKKRFK